MHKSSMMKAELFVKHYVVPLTENLGKCHVLEIGSKSYSNHDTYKNLFQVEMYTYTGIDVEDGPNVDVIPKGYLWHELDNASFDVCISGQTFEHNPFFWVTFAEMARVLRPDGYVFVVAPGAGAAHRYPYDCWRFYPDAWQALCNLTGLELIESYFESDDMAILAPGGDWRDSAVIARKPRLSDEMEREFYRNLESITTPLREKSFDIRMDSSTGGPCFQEYEELIRNTYGPLLPKLLRMRLRGRTRTKLLHRI